MGINPLFHFIGKRNKKTPQIMLDLFEAENRRTMSLSYASFFYSLILGLFSTLIFVFLLRHFRVGKKGTGSLTPSPPRFPFIGNLHQLGKLPHHSLRSLSTKYGPVMLLQLGHVPTLVISSADMAREVMKTQDTVFANRPRSTAVEMFLNGYLDIAFAPYGDYWRQIRKLSVIELLSQARVQSYQFVRKEEVDILVNKIKTSCQTRAVVDLSDMLLSITNNIMSRSVLGHKCEAEDGKLGFAELSKRVSLQFVAFSFGDWFPSLAWIDVLTGLIPRLKETHRAMNDYFDTVIEEHKKSANHGQAEKREDFIDILLQAQKDEVLGFDLTLGSIKAILVDMIVGGTDTTTATMEWAMAELIKHPSKMKKAQEEVRRVVGKKPEIDPDDITQMQYLRCVIKETLRLHPPIPFLLPRETISSTEVAGFEVPAKTRVLINSWASQRDPNVWDKPEEFVPERFIDSPVDFEGQDFQLIPFGGGRRGCPGITFGITSSEFVIANLLYHFNWELPRDETWEDLDMQEVYALTVHKKIPLRLVPVLNHPKLP